jgi:2-keto-4-pentenoate hydratase/2-oxohepta-3-ene-1,7-dioic acid hydratase in catechol pathway
MMRRRNSLLIALAMLFALLLVCARSLAEEKKVTKYVRFRADDTVAYGIVEGDRVRQLDGNLFRSWKPTDVTHKLSDVKLLAPSQPSKVLAAALNYKSHAGEKTPPTEPQFFFKAPTCLVAPGGKIVIPKGATNVHYEAEMVIVIGKRAKNVPEERALEHVLGVTCGNDISARDWQSGDIQWWRAKGSDTFGPCGPMIVSGIDYDDLLVQLRQNGELKQKERTSQMTFSVAQLVSFVSRHVTLKPGDLIFTGTAGTTSSIKPGDVLEVELEGVGVLKNTVVGAR